MTARDDTLSAAAGINDRTHGAFSRMMPRMIPWFEIISLAGLGVLAWLWFDGVKAREEAVRVARQACLAEGYQFLDDTVAGVSLRPVRDDAGRLVLRRSYAFEYSDTGDNRRPGRVEMMGQVVEQLEIGPRLGTPRRVI